MQINTTEEWTPAEMLNRDVWPGISELSCGEWLLYIQPQKKLEKCVTVKYILIPSSKINSDNSGIANVLESFDHSPWVVVICSGSGRTQLIEIIRSDMFSRVYTLHGCLKHPFAVDIRTAWGDSPKPLAAEPTPWGKQLPVQQEFLALGSPTSDISGFHPTDVQ